jgi:hypothetical protein
MTGTLFLSLFSRLLSIAYNTDSKGRAVVAMLVGWCCGLPAHRVCLHRTFLVRVFSDLLNK